MGTTGTYGLPFPEDTDPVAQGAAAIEALAEAVETLIQAPYLDAYLTANLAINGGVTKTVLGLTEVEDTFGILDPATGIITIPAGQGGVWEFVLGYSIARTSGVVSAANAWWAKNGTAQEPPRAIIGNAGANTPDAWEGTLTSLRRMAPGDTMRAMLQGNATSSVLVGGLGAAGTTIRAARVGR